MLPTGSLAALLCPDGQVPLANGQLGSRMTLPLRPGRACCALPHQLLPHPSHCGGPTSNPIPEDSTSQAHSYLRSGQEGRGRRAPNPWSTLGTPFISQAHTQPSQDIVRHNTHSPVTIQPLRPCSHRHSAESWQAEPGSHAHLCCLICRMENLLAGSYSNIPV